MLNKITHRLILGFSVPVVTLIFLSAFIFTNTRGVEQRENAVKNAYKNQGTAVEIAYSTARIVGGMRGYIIYPGSKSYRDTFEDSVKDFNEQKAKIRDFTDPRQQDNLKRMIELGEEYIKIGEEVIVLVDTQKIEEAKQKASIPRLGELEEARTEIGELINAEVNKNLEEAHRAETFLMWLIIIGSILNIIVCILIGLWVIIPLQRQLPQAIYVAEQIAEGNLTQTVEASQDGSEIGQLMVAFRDMVEKLNSLIFQIQKSGVQISTSATGIAASGKQLEATVAEQLASTNEVSATAQEIAATSKELTKTMDRVSELAQSTTIAAEKSQDKLTKMEKVMRQLAEATTLISSKLGVMSEKASSINSVVTTINKVADQTNLLSLNAAIEAEKAGEYGSGFAVVAREIRRLADQTAVATLEIAQMVKEMQSAVSLGVMEMDKFNKSVVNSVENVANISQEIAQVITQVQGLTPRFEQVSQSVDEQSLAAQQISEAMTQLSEAAQQTADALRENNRTLGNLDDAADGLRVEVSKFKVAA